MKSEELLDGYLADKVVRLEQKIAKKYGQTLAYNETETYKNFSRNQKKKLYLFFKRKKIQNLIGLFLISFLGASFLSLNNPLTGNFLRNNFDTATFSYLNLILIIILFLVIIIFICIFIFRRQIKKRFNKLFEIIDKKIK